MNKTEIKSVFSKYLINETKYPEVPRTLDGEYFIKELKGSKGESHGFITIDLDRLYSILHDVPEEDLDSDPWITVETNFKIQSQAKQQEIETAKSIVMDNAKTDKERIDAMSVLIKEKIL